MAGGGSSKPLIAGGRTLSKMRRGKSGGGGKSKQGKKAVWYEAFGLTFNGPGPLGAWPTGEPPEWVRLGMTKSLK